MLDGLAFDLKTKVLLCVGVSHREGLFMLIIDAASTLTEAPRRPCARVRIGVFLMTHVAFPQRFALVDVFQPLNLAFPRVAFLAAVHFAVLVCSVSHRG